MIADAHGPLAQPTEVSLAAEPGLSVVAVDAALPRADDATAAA